jgi:hypothetical protein
MCNQKAAIIRTKIKCCNDFSTVIMRTVATAYAPASSSGFLAG